MTGHATGAGVGKHPRRKSAATPSSVKMVMMFAGLVILVLALPPFIEFPWLSFWLLPLAAIYLFLLLILPRLWLVVLPLATVGMDITPFTGRFAYNELDLVFLVTLASGLLYGRYRYSVFKPRPAIIVLFCYLLVIALGSSGWRYFVLPPGTGFENPYYTSEYAYKMLKGMVWGLALVPMWGFLMAVDKRRSVNALVAGMSVAALLLGFIVLWERGTLGVILDGSWGDWLSSFLGLSSAYRVTGIFSAMHTGGKAVDGVVLLLLPAALYAATYGRAVWLRVLGALGVLTLAYVTLVGLTGAASATFTIALMLYVFFTLNSRRKNGMELTVAPGDTTKAVTVGILTVAFAVGGYLINDRVVGDADPGESHWDNVIASSGGGIWRGLFGNGIGSFPGGYLGRHPQYAEDVGSFSVTSVQNRDVLRLVGSRNLTFGQRVSIEPYANYVVNVYLRAEEAGSLAVWLCERNLVFSGNFTPHCEQGILPFEATEDTFEQYTVEINSSKVGERGSLRRWPTVMTLHYETPGKIVEIDAIDLSADGFNVLRNSSFKQGLDYWLAYDDHAHQSWRIGNIYLQLWFENGWLGLGLFLALVGLLVYRNFQPHSHDSLLPAYTTGVLGICLFGFYWSPLDAARVSWLFYFFLAAGLAELRVKNRQDRAAPIKQGE
tara:strand:- start:75165 stop:77153 length:1989 start_codon:yes stop_codon:yes gene_type:complete